MAQIVIPMAVSLAFGILFATVITLLLVPCLYMMMHDIRNLLRGRKKQQHVGHYQQSDPQAVDQQ